MLYLFKKELFFLIFWDDHLQFSSIPFIKLLSLQWKVQFIHLEIAPAWRINNLKTWFDQFWPYLWIFHVTKPLLDSVTVFSLSRTLILSFCFCFVGCLSVFQHDNPRRIFTFNNCCFFYLFFFYFNFKWKILTINSPTDSVIVWAFYTRKCRKLPFLWL